MKGGLYSGHHLPDEDYSPLRVSFFAFHLIHDSVHQIDESAMTIRT